MVSILFPFWGWAGGGAFQVQQLKLVSPLLSYYNFFFSSLTNSSIYLSFRFLLFLFYEPLKRQNSQDNKLINTRFNFLTGIRRSVRIWKFQRILSHILSDGISWTIPYGSPFQPTRALYSFCESLLIERLTTLYLNPSYFPWRWPWCNGYRRRKWTWRHEFKS